MQRFVGFVGFKGCGKNTAADALVEDGWAALSYADTLKDVVAAMFCWPRHLLEGDTIESRVFRDMVDPWWSSKLGIPNFTPRFALTHIGTDILREFFNDFLWIYNLERRMSLIDPGRNIVVLDCRYPNEISLARQKNAKMFRVRRGDEPDWYDTALKANAGDMAAENYLKNELKIHDSEWRWIGLPVDAIIENNLGVAELHKSVRDLTYS